MRQSLQLLVASGGLAAMFAVSACRQSPPAEKPAATAEKAAESTARPAEKPAAPAAAQVTPAKVREVAAAASASRPDVAVPLREAPAVPPPDPAAVKAALERVRHRTPQLLLKPDPDLGARLRAVMKKAPAPAAAPSKTP